jgi:hypothetical protein
MARAKASFIFQPPEISVISLACSTTNTAAAQATEDIRQLDILNTPSYKKEQGGLLVCHTRGPSTSQLWLTELVAFCCLQLPAKDSGLSLLVMRWVT